MFIYICSFCYVCSTRCGALNLKKFDTDINDAIERNLQNSQRNALAENKIETLELRFISIFVAFKIYLQHFEIHVCPPFLI